MTGSPVKKARKQRFESLIADEARAMQEICAHVSNGHGLKNFAIGKNIALSSIHDWIRRNPQRTAMYDEARVIGAGVLVEKSIEVLDECERDKNGLPTSATVMLAKTKSETLRWIAARLAPKDWGDSLHMTAEVTVKVDIRNILARREEKLRLLEAEAIEVEMLPHFGQVAELPARESQQVFQQSPEIQK